MMHYTHRAWHYITKKRKVNFLLFIFLIVISTFLLTGAIIAGYSVDTSAHLKKLMGASFWIAGNIDESSINEDTMDFETHPVSEQDVGFIEEMPEVIESNYEARYIIKSDIDFVASGVDYDNSGMCLVNSDSQLNSLFQKQYIKLLEGIHIVEGDVMEVMISSQLAQENQIEIGDTIELYHDNNAVVVTVVGIFEGIQDVNELLQDEVIIENMLFLNEYTMQQLIENDKIEYEKVIFYLNDPTVFPSVKAEVLENVDMNKYIVKDDTDTYESLTMQLNRYQNIIFLLIGVCVVASIINIVSFTHF